MHGSFVLLRMTAWISANNLLLLRNVAGEAPALHSKLSFFFGQRFYSWQHLAF